MSAPATETTGASGSTPRAETVDAINAVWNRSLRSIQTDGEAIPAETGIAIASALLYVGDEIRALRAELRWPHDQDLPKVGE